jgi:hypothetical protein
MFQSELRFFPLVITAIRNDLTGQDVDALERFFREVHAREQRFLNLVDARTAQRPNSLLRSRLAEVTKSFLDDTKRLQAANAVVLDTKVESGAMTALRWLVPAPVPERYFTTPLTALDWLAEASRIPVRSDARAFVQLLESQPGIMSA